jgi:hypothetical protein
MSEALLREYTRTALTESDVGADWGISIKPGRLYDTFINPFIDVFRVARAETEKLSASLQRLVLTIKEAVVATALPHVKGKYDQIRGRERVQIQRINSKYADVYQRVQAGIDFPDFQLALFMRSPGAYLASRILSMSGEVAKEVTSTLTGRASFDQSIDLGTGRVKSKVHWQQYQESTRHGHLLERVDAASLAAELDKSPVIKSMQKAALQARQASLNEMVDLAKNIASAKTLDSFESILGKRVDINIPDGVSQEQLAPALELAKAAILGKIIEMLKNDPAAAKGGPEIKSLYDKCIRQIATLT